MSRSHPFGWRSRCARWLPAIAVGGCLVLLTACGGGPIADRGEPPPAPQEELGLDNELPANLPEQNRIVEQNSQHGVENNDTLGVPNTEKNDPIAYAPPGADAKHTGGVAGTAGDFIS